MAQIVQHPSFGGQSNSKKIETGIADSSFLMHLAYDQSSMQLTVTMKDGGQYLYPQIYPQTVDDFMQAPSKGEYYSKFIRGKYPSTRIVDKNVGPRISAKTKKKGS